MRGLRGPLSCLNEARYGIVWGVMGAARACFESALEYAKTRRQFGKPIGSFQLVAAKLADADLAVLGQAADKYHAYAGAVRQEYAHVPASDYREGRAHVLAKIRSQRPLYHTPWFQDRFESQARANLARERDQLGAG